MNERAHTPEDLDEFARRLAAIERTFSAPGKALSYLQAIRQLQAESGEKGITLSMMREEANKKRYISVPLSDRIKSEIESFKKHIETIFAAISGATYDDKDQ